VKTIEEVKKASEKGNVIPIYTELLADLDTPITALLKLGVDAEQIFLLESVEGGEKIARYSFLGKTPLYVFRSKGNQINIDGITPRSFQGDPIAELKKFFGQFKGVLDANLPNFAGGGVGFVAYDSIRLIENIPDTGEDTFDLEDIHIGVYDTFIVFDNIKHQMYLVANVLVDVYGSLENAYKVAVNNLSRLERELSHSFSLPAATKATPGRWSSNLKQQTFEEAVKKCKKYILEGDAFQIVLSQRFTTEVETDGMQIYRALRTINPSPYMYYLKLSNVEIVGASPEMLVRVNNGIVETRPIAGSRPRGKTEKEDSALEQELLRDEKERAEHIMLVDLGRNDVGKISRYGTVKVTQFMQVEKYSHIMHIVSGIQGTLREDTHCLDALISCFPAGTLSGAPKIRAMEIIDELEPHKRGIYGGAICYLDFNGNLDSCIAIRTMVLKNGTAYVQAGAGIVADSHPESEFIETKNKAAALMKALELAERIK